MPKVLIFGATGGIGRQIAQDLAQKGVSLHLVGRAQSDVAALAGQLGASFSHAQAEDTNSLAEAVKQADDGSGIAGLVWAIGSILLKPLAALSEADFVYVKNWSSYNEYGSIHRDPEWIISREKMRVTNEAKLMHCLPVRRNVVISEEILESPQSVVLQQAGNRVCAAQAVLVSLLKENG